MSEIYMIIYLNLFKCRRYIYIYIIFAEYLVHFSFLNLIKCNQIPILLTFIIDIKISKNFCCDITSAAKIFVKRYIL